MKSGKEDFNNYFPNSESIRNVFRNVFRQSIRESSR